MKLSTAEHEDSDKDDTDETRLLRGLSKSGVERKSGPLNSKKIQGPPDAHVTVKRLTPKSNPTEYAEYAYAALPVLANAKKKLKYTRAQARHQRAAFASCP